MKKFLIVVDTQYDFVIPGGALYVSSAEEIITPGIQFLAGLDPEDYAGVLFTADTHLVETYYTTPESEQFPIHCVRDTAGWQNVFNPDLVHPSIPILHLEKGVFSMWEEKGLLAQAPRRWDIYKNIYRDAVFKDLQEQGVTTVQVMGVASDYCVKWAVDGLVQRGFDVEVIQDLCRGIGQPANEVFLGVAEYEKVKLI